MACAVRDTVLQCSVCSVRAVCPVSHLEKGRGRLQDAVAFGDVCRAAAGSADVSALRKQADRKSAGKTVKGSKRQPSHHVGGGRGRPAPVSAGGQAGCTNFCLCETDYRFSRTEKYLRAVLSGWRTLV